MVSDAQMGLVWMEAAYKLTKDNGAPEYSASATALAANSAAANGYKDWRVPTKAEYAAIDVADFPKYFGTAAPLYETDLKDYYTNNGLTSEQQTINSHWLRLVRGSQTTKKN
jgi:Protein of unknown function (DUF1566)